MKNHELSGSGESSSSWDNFMTELPNELGGGKVYEPSPEAVNAAKQAEYDARTESREEYLKTMPNELGGGRMYEPSEEAVRAAKQAEYDARRESREEYLSKLPNDVPQVSYEDPDKYRKETTGTTNPEIAKAVTEASKFDFSPKGIDQTIDKIIDDPSAVQKMLELRMHRTADFMEGVGDYNKETITSDINFILNLAGKEYDFSGFKVDLNTELGGEPKIVDFSGMVEWYEKGLERMKEKGKDTKVEVTPRPDVPTAAMDASEALKFITENIEQPAEKAS